MVKTKMPTPKVIRRRKLKTGEVEQTVIEAKQTEIVFEESNKKVPASRSKKKLAGAIKTDEIDIFTTDLESVESMDVAVAVCESAKEKKDISAFLPTDLEKMDLRKQVDVLSKSIDTNQFELGRILYFIEINKSYEDWGFKDFPSYLRAEEAGKYRRAKYLVDLHRWFVTKIKDDKKIDAIKSVGWSKAKEIQRVIGNDETESVDKWVNCALKLNAEDLSITVRDEIKSREAEAKEASGDEVPNVKGPIEESKKVESDIPQDDKTPLVLKLYAEDYLLVKQMLKWAEKESGTDDQSRNMVLIAQEFLMNVQPTGDKNNKEFVKQYLSRIQERFNIRLIALEGEKQVVFFGGHLLQ